MKPKAKPSRAAVARQLAEKVRDSTRDGSEIVEHLLRIMRDDDVAASDRIKAATTLLDRGYGRATEHVTISAGDQAESAVARMADAALEALLAGMRTVEGEIVRPGTRDLEDGETRSLPDGGFSDPQKSDGSLRNLMVPEGVETPSGSSEPADAEIVATGPIEDAAPNPSRDSRPGTHDLPPPVRVTPCQSEKIGALERDVSEGRQNPIPPLPATLDQDRDGQRADVRPDGGAGRADGGGAGRSVEGSRGAGGGANPCPSTEGRPGTLE